MSPCETGRSIEIENETLSRVSILCHQMLTGIRDNEQTHKKRKINTSSKSKVLSLAWVWEKKTALGWKKHQQHTNQDWNRGEKRSVPLRAHSRKPSSPPANRCPGGQRTSEGS